LNEVTWVDPRKNLLIASVADTTVTSALDLMGKVEISHGGAGAWIVPAASAVGLGKRPTGRCKSCLHLFVGALILGNFFCQPVFGEGPVKLDITLGASALKDPLIELVLPPKGSMDTLTYGPEGILIKQVADQLGVKTGVAGLKLLSNVEGDFSFQLDFEVIKLARPKKGWGQGLVIRILTDDKNAPIMALGCVATLQKDRMYWVNLQRGPGKPPDQSFFPADFKKGTWTVDRRGKEIILSVQEDKGPAKEIARRPCTDASLQGIHVWSVRQESGNTEAEFLLKRVRLNADSFLSYKEPPTSWSWGWIAAGIAVISLATAAVVAFQRRK
jgi:hypothetical protein